MREQTQGNTLQDVLKWEEDGFFSRDEIMIKKGEVLALGAVVATDSGEAVEVDVDTPGDAYGITIAAYDATDAAVPGVVIARNARIDPDNLVWPVISPVVTDEQKAAVLAVLAAKGIIPASGAVEPVAPSED